MEVQNLKRDFPVIHRLTSTTVETAIEIIEKKGGFAFVNNSFSYAMVGMNHKKLVDESVKFQGKDIDENKAALKKAIEEQFKNKDLGLIQIIFEHVLTLVFLNIGGGFALERAIKKYNEGKEA